MDRKNVILLFFSLLQKILHSSSIKLKNFLKCCTSVHGSVTKDLEQTDQTVIGEQLPTGSSTTQNPEPGTASHTVAEGKVLGSNRSVSGHFNFQQPTEAQKPANMDDREFHELREARNILEAAYKELTTLAFEATWGVSIPPGDSAEEFVEVPQSSATPGMRVEQSIKTTDLPISPENLIAILMDVDKYRSTFNCIIHQASVDASPSVLQKLGLVDPTIQCIRMFKAGFQFPIPFLPIRNFCFLRCQKMIPGKGWAIIDVPFDYFHNTPSESTSGQECHRRPSGVLIRRRGENSEATWIENVDVHEHQEPEILFSTLLNSKLAFSAKHWISALSRRIKRRNGRFPNLNMEVSPAVHGKMLNLIGHLEREFMDCVSKEPCESEWSQIYFAASEVGRTIFRKRTRKSSDPPDTRIYISLTCFRLQVKPMSAFLFLVHHNMWMQWHSLRSWEMPVEVSSFTAEDDSDFVTLHRKLVSRSEQLDEYFLQVASMDEFCSFVISSPITQPDVLSSLVHEESTKPFLLPSGFAVMPNGPGGLQSDSCLVTVAILRDIYVSEDDQATPILRELTDSIVPAINEAAINQY